jgi:RIO-like serine/threonine protein kinase
MAHEDVSTSYLHSSLVILSSLIHEGHFSYIFRGQSGTTSIIGKLARNVSQANLRAEFSVYQKLSPLQGSAIPRYFGLFNVQSLGLLLLLEDCGQSIRAFDELSNRQRAALIDHMFTIHKYGICHGDLEPRNIVVSPAGKMTVIDFEMSDQTHCCEDKKCMELDDLRNILQVDVERSVTTKTTGNGQDYAQPRYRYILLALAVILAGQYWL